MNLIKQQYLEDNQGHKIAVVVPIEEYNRMIEELEEYEDVKAYDTAKAHNQTFRPLREAIVDIETKRKQ